jgi:hypothetical protein
VVGALVPRARTIMPAYGCESSLARAPGITRGSSAARGRSRAAASAGDPPPATGIGWGEKRRRNMLITREMLNWVAGIRTPSPPCRAAWICRARSASRNRRCCISLTWTSRSQVLWFMTQPLRVIGAGRGGDGPCGTLPVWGRKNTCSFSATIVSSNADRGGPLSPPL